LIGAKVGNLSRTDGWGLGNYLGTDGELKIQGGLFYASSFAKPKKNSPLRKFN